jgi:hypothetical protein
MHRSSYPPAVTWGLICLETDFHIAKIWEEQVSRQDSRGTATEQYLIVAAMSSVQADATLEQLYVSHI